MNSRRLTNSLLIVIAALGGVFTGHEFAPRRSVEDPGPALSIQRSEALSVLQGSDERKRFRDHFQWTPALLLARYGYPDDVSVTAAGAVNWTYKGKGDAKDMFFTLLDGHVVAAS